MLVSSPLPTALPGLHTVSFAGWQPRPGRRWRVALLVLALHGLALLGLMQAGALARRLNPPAPVQVALLSEPAPAPAPQPQRSTPAAPPLPQALRVPLPEIPSPSPSREATAQPLALPPAPPQAQAAAPSPAPLLAPAPAAPPAPKPISSSALRWRVEPAVELPRLSRRAGESGRVLLRVVFDASGAPRDVQLQKSSGFPRLDAQAFEALRVARIAPFTEDGRPIEVVATAVLDYELE